MRHRLFFLLSVLVAGCLWAGAAPADTVYFKSGRTLTSANVRVEGDRVYVQQYSGVVVFPLAIVERIVDDESKGPEAISPTPEPVPDAPAGGEETGATDDQEADAGEAAAADPHDDEEDEGEETESTPVPPERTRAYWRARIEPLKAQIQEIDRQLARWRTQTSADAQAQLARGEANRGRYQAQLDAVIREGRRMGLPIGWLR